METTERTKIRRDDRASYEIGDIYGILDEGLVCHVGFEADGDPVVIPTIYGREHDTLFLHGSIATRMMRTLKPAPAISVCVSLVDGLVVARSAFHHSLNFRSVVLFGRAEPLDDLDAKQRALAVIVDHVISGRSRECRPPTRTELRETTVLALPISEASAKIRTGPPVDDTEDLDLPHWAGVVPLSTVAGPPVPASDLAEGINTPENILGAALDRRI